MNGWTDNGMNWWLNGIGQLIRLSGMEKMNEQMHGWINGQMNE